MKLNVLFFISILISTKMFCCDVVLNITEQKTYYLEAVNSSENTINLIIKSGKMGIKGITLVDDDALFDVKKGKYKRRDKKTSYVITKKDDNTQKKRLKIEIEDVKGNKYFLTLLFYSTKYNIDELPETYNIVYNKNKDYPIALTSNSHVIGNYYIFDEFGAKVSYFEILTTFTAIIDTLKEGNYLFCENDIDNPLFSFTVSSN